MREKQERYFKGPLVEKTKEQPKVQSFEGGDKTTVLEEGKTVGKLKEIENIEERKAKIAKISREVRREGELSDLKSELKIEAEKYKETLAEFEKLNEEYKRDFTISSFGSFFTSLYNKFFEEEREKGIFNRITELEKQRDLSLRKMAKLERGIQEAESLTDKIKEVENSPEVRAKYLAELKKEAEEIKKEVDFHRMNLERGIDTQSAAEIAKKTDRLAEIKKLNSEMSVGEGRGSLKSPEIEGVNDGADIDYKIKTVEDAVSSLKKEVTKKKNKINELTGIISKKQRDGEGVENIKFEMKANMAAVLSLGKELSSAESELKELKKKRNELVSVDEKMKNAA